MHTLYVLPIAPGKKTPLEKEWQFNLAPWGEAQARWPGVSRWAAPAGPVNGHWVYDEDPRHGGPESTRILEATHGPLPKTHTTRTPSGGRHLRFRCRDDRPVRNKQAALAGIDVRGTGGYALIAPTADYVVLDAREPADAPDWLYTALGLHDESEPVLQSDRPAGLGTDPRAAREDCKVWPPAIQGEGGSNKLFGLCLRLVRGHGLSLKDAADLIEDAYNNRCEPPWTRAEIEHKVEDAATKGQVPWGYTFYQGSLPEVLRRAFVRFGPASNLNACIPYRVYPDGSMQPRIGEASAKNTVLEIADCMGVDKLSLPDANAIVRWWSAHTTPTGLFPKPLALGDEPGPSLVRLQVEDGTTPAWDEFLSRLSCPDTFLAWVWMLTFPEPTRQVLWISGEGKDGKTQVSNTLLELFGEAGTTCTDDYLENSGRWLGSQIYGKRLVVVDDTKMRQVLRRGIVHRITGSSGMKMEAKGNDGFDFKPQCALLCTSNFTPLCGRGRADKSRVLPLTVVGEDRPSDKTWAPRLLDEMPALLGRAKRAYEALAIGPGEAELRLTPPVASAVALAAGFDRRSYIAQLEKAGLALAPEKSIKGAELFNRLQAKPQSSEWQDMNDWLKEQGVTCKETNQGSVWTGIGSILE